MRSLIIRFLRALPQNLYSKIIARKLALVLLYENLEEVFHAIKNWKKLHENRKVLFVAVGIADQFPVKIAGPSPNEILVQTKYSCISKGTERAVLLSMPNAERKFPYAPGYSGSGIIKDVGKNITSHNVGDLVIGSLSHSELGRYKATELTNLGPYTSENEDVCKIASISEIAVIVQQAVRKAKIRPDDKILVIGNGLLGKLCGIYIRAFNPNSITCVQRSTSKEKNCNIFDEYITGIADCGKNKYQVIIEAAGSIAAIKTGFLFASKETRTFINLGSPREWATTDLFDSLFLKAPECDFFSAHVSLTDKHPCSSLDQSFLTRKDERAVFGKLVKAGIFENIVGDIKINQTSAIDINQAYHKLANSNDKQLQIFQW